MQEGPPTPPRSDLQDRERNLEVTENIYSKQETTSQQRLSQSCSTEVRCDRQQAIRASRAARKNKDECAVS